MELGEWKKASLRVALIGDSTLDNILWVEDDPCVPEQLAAALPCAAVCNLAADGFNSTNALRGHTCVISSGTRKTVGDPVDFSADGVFRPLEKLAELTPPPTHVVLSIGGNDVREILGRIDQLPTIMATFAQNYPKLVEGCLKVAPVILMWQYRPSFAEDNHYGVYQAIGTLPGPGSSVEKLNKLMEEIYKPVLDLARKHSLPIVDLPRTFNIHDPELYNSQIEPSAKGGAVISTLLRHVVLNHEKSTTSTLYSLNPCSAETGKINAEPNDGSTWTIPTDNTHSKPSSFCGCFASSSGCCTM